MEPVRKMFSRPVNSGVSPALTSISAPTRPAISTFPAVWYITREMIFSSVDFPAPFAPTSAHDSPGSTRRLMSLSAQRQLSASCERSRSLTPAIRSCR